MESLAERPPIIRGEHVYLRPSERGDLPRFVRWFNDADVTHHLAMRGPMSFTHEGTLRKAHYARGERIDVDVMSLLRDEWEALPHRRSWEPGA